MVNLETESKTQEINALSQRELYKIRSAAINKFANMGLSGREISFAVEIVTGNKVKTSIVKNLIHRSRLRGIVRQLTSEEKADIRRTTGNPWDYTYEVMKEDVLSILQNIKRLQEEGKPLPRNRLDLREFRISAKASPNGRKEGGIKVGNSIVFPDGTHLPTSEGLGQTEKQRQKTAERKHSQKNKERVRKISKVYELIGPLCARAPQVSGVEWSYLTQFSKKPLDAYQIKQAAARKGRPGWHSMPGEYNSSENARKRHENGREFAMERDRLTAGTISPEDYNKFILENENRKFVAHFLEIGFFGWDITAWNQVKEMYVKHKKVLPSFLHLLIAEVYFAAIQKAVKGDMSLLNEYSEIRRETSQEGLSLTEGFIKAKLLTDWADGEDEKGFYELKDGMKVRHVEIVDDKFVNGNSRLAIEKLRIINGRNGNGNGRNGMSHSRSEES